MGSASSSQLQSLVAGYCSIAQSVYEEGQSSGHSALPQLSKRTNGAKSRGKQKLRELFNKGLERLGLSGAILDHCRAGILERWQLMAPFTNGTTTPQGWTAERLQMRSQCQSTTQSREKG